MIKKIKGINTEMNIVLKDETPLFCRPSRLPIAEREIVDWQVEEWVEDDIVESCSSEYEIQVIVVKKRKFNRNTVKDRYPLPVS